MLVNSLYILWGLLYLALLIYIFRAFITVTKKIREAAGWVAAAVFVVAIFSFAGQEADTPNAFQNNTSKEGTWRADLPDSVRNTNTIFRRLVLEKTVLATQTLEIVFGWNAAQNSWVALGAFAYTTGFFSGTSWDVRSIHISTPPGSATIHYSVLAKIDWSLPFMRIYRQENRYEGDLPIPLGYHQRANPSMRF